MNKYFKYIYRCYSTNAAEWRQVIRNVRSVIHWKNFKIVIAILSIFSVCTIACCDECNRICNRIRLVVKNTFQIGFKKNNFFFSKFKGDRHLDNILGRLTENYLII